MCSSFLRRNKTANIVLWWWIMCDRLISGYRGQKQMTKCVTVIWREYIVNG